MKAALIACALFWCLLLGLWIAHDVNETCGADTACRAQEESPQ